MKARLVESFMNENENNLHYELLELDEKTIERLKASYVITEPNQKLYQIKATKDLPQHNIKKGDLGGFVSGTHNLRDNAWITYDAEEFNEEYNSFAHGVCVVMNDAVVSKNALLKGTVSLSDSSIVTDNAVVEGHILIDADTIIKDNAIVIMNGDIINTKIKDNARILLGDVDGAYICDITLEGSETINEEEAEEYGFFD